MGDGRRTELIEGNEGPRLAKVATDDLGRRLISQETARLNRARHPGVVELVRHDEERIELAWAGDRTLELASLDIEAASALLAAVTATVADLHELGVVHGRLDPSHVVVGHDGGPRLCGMSGPRPGEPEPSPADDVAALGRLIHRAVDAGVDVEPIPERRWRRRRWTGYQQRALQNLADQAQAEEADRRPSARTLATSIAQVVPAARLNRPDPTSCDLGETRAISHEPPGVPPSPDVLRRRFRIGAAVGASALLALVAIVNIRPAHRSPDEAFVPVPRGAITGLPGSTPGTGDMTTTTMIHRSTTVPAGCSPAMGASADVDADGCPEPVGIDGTTITAGDVVFRVGEADDHVAMGDWTCSGTVTPGLVRPATGEVFLFHRWPEDHESVEGEVVAIVPDGRRLVTAEVGCGAPAVESSDGAVTQLADLEGR